MEPYEITYIVRPDLDEERIRGVVDALNGRLGEGGELIATYPWNPPRRRMAFPIRDFGDGYYVTTTFNYPPQELRELERGLRLNGNILRFLIVQATPANVQQSQQRAQQHQARLAGLQQGAPQPGAPQPVGVAPQGAPAPQPVGAAAAAPRPEPAPAPQAPAQQAPTEQPPSPDAPAAPAPEPASAATETQG